MKLLKRLTDDGYIYMIDYRHGRDHLTKIGTSVDPDSRFAAIRSSVPRRAKMKIIMKMKVFAPYEKEATIHGWFYEKRTRPRGAGARAGATEFFRLGRTDKLKVYMTLWLWSVWRITVLMILFLALVSAFIYILADVFI